MLGGVGLGEEKRCGVHSVRTSINWSVHALGIKIM